MIAERKVCKRCGVDQPRTAYGKEPRTRDGLRARCKDCCNAQRAAWRAANPGRSSEEAQRRKAYQREWRRANPERVRAYRQTQASKADSVDYLTQWRKCR